MSKNLIIVDDDFPFRERLSRSMEKKVFIKHRDDPNPKTKDWIVYHSLKYPVSIEKKNRKSFKHNVFRSKTENSYKNTNFHTKAERSFKNTGDRKIFI